jgi:preprotein translocase subunit SecF
MKYNFKFMKHRTLAVGFSTTLIVISLAAIFIKGLNLGLDFTGGTSIEVSYSHEVNLEEVRAILVDGQFKDAVVQYYGTNSDVLVRLSSTDAKIGEQVLEALKEKSNNAIELRSVSIVGPQVGGELRDQGGIGLLAATALIFLYVAMRFQTKFALGAILALLHDPIIVIGSFALFGWQFDLTVLAATLAVMGYSINDTIVIYDRIRENFRKLRKTPVGEVIDISLNETLARTINLSFVTLLSVIALLIFGGETINGFAKAMSIGIVVGTYSSIYVAASLLVYMKVTTEDLIPPTREGEEFDRP